MAQITPQDFSFLREKFKDEKIVYCSGAFDLLHPGHVLFFEDCKKLGEVLVVGIGGDSDIKKRKGSNRPIMNLIMRLKLIDSLKNVDYVFPDTHVPKNHPLEFLDIIFGNLHPDVYVVNQDAFDMPYRESVCKKYGVKMEILERWCPPEFENISTSKLIEKIKSI